MGGTDARAASGGPMRAANNFVLATDLCGPRARDPQPDVPDWRVDVPLRVRGRCRRGGLDVALEFVRVDVGVQRPPGAPARDAAWPSTSGRSTEKKPSLPARAADLCETALVVACLGAADPHGAGARVSLALAAGGAARAATFAVAARRRASAADGFDAREPSSTKPKNGKMETSKPSPPVGRSARVTAPGALVARLCDAAFLLHVSGAALRAVAPESHHAVKSAAALAGVRVAFSQPTKKRRRKNAAGSVAETDSTGRAPPPASRDAFAATRAASFEDDAGGVDVNAWHARYRWAALRLAPFVPPRPRPPKFENALAAMAGLAVAASAVGADDPRGVVRGLATSRVTPPDFGFGHGHRHGSSGFGPERNSRGVGGASGGRGPRVRLDASWVARRGTARRDERRGSPWATRGDVHGVNLRVAFADLDRVTAADILAPPRAEPPSESGGSAGSSPAPDFRRLRTTDSDAAADAVRTRASGSARGRGGGGGDGDTSPAIAPVRLANVTSVAGSGSVSGVDRSTSTRDDAGPETFQATRGGDIWRDARFDGRGASAAELVARAAYLICAFLPVFLFAVPLLVFAESELLKALCARVRSRGDAAAAARVRAALRRRAFSTAHFSISLCGAALVKWAQWASVRRDVFPGDFCDAMGHFHDDAPKHSYAQTAREVRRHLGVPVERVFAHFPKHPVASGSVAQVYRAVLRPEVATACAARDPEFARRIAAEARRCRRSEAFRVYARGAGASSSAATSATFRNVSSAPRRARFRVFGSASSESGERTGARGGGGGETADALARAALSADAAEDASAAAAADLSARTVAVKVRHPGVARQIFLDFQILKRAARALRRVPALRGLNLEETLGQFSHTMTSQTDLRVEARHLRRFGRNFRRATQIIAPWPVCGLATEGVLCETFERGEALSSAIRRGCEDNATTCALGVDTYLKMLLRDNFLHSDLHPGNILYHREADVLDVGDACDSVPDRAARARRAKARVDGVRLVLLDFGIADALPGDVRDRFLTFLFSLARQDGIAAANSLLTWSETQTCVGADADGLRADIARLVDEKCALRAASVDIDAVLKRVMTILRARGVSIDAVFASLVVSMCVLVGFATALDENLNLFEVAISAFLSWSVTGDVAGKLYA